MINLILALKQIYSLHIQLLKTLYKTTPVDKVIVLKWKNRNTQRKGKW